MCDYLLSFSSSRQSKDIFYDDPGYMEQARIGDGFFNSDNDADGFHVSDGIEDEQEGQESLGQLELEHKVLGFKGMSAEGRETLVLGMCFWDPNEYVRHRFRLTLLSLGTAKLRSAEKQIEHLKTESDTNLAAADNARAELKLAQDQIRSLNRQFKLAESKADKIEAALSKTEVSSKDLARDLADARNELQVAKRIVKELEKTIKAKDTK